MMLLQPSSSCCRRPLSPSIESAQSGLGAVAFCLASAAADNIQPWNVTSGPHTTLTLEHREETRKNTKTQEHTHTHSEVILQSSSFVFYSNNKGF